jgi:hypothetical protein
MENIARAKRLFGLLALPPWLVVGYELAEPLHLASSVVEHWPWFATPHGRLFVLLFALAWLFILVIVPERWLLLGRKSKQIPVDPLREKTLQLGRDLFAFLREKPELPPDPPMNIPNAEWSTKTKEQWAIAGTHYHGYAWRFQQRVIDLFHELAEHGIEDKPIKWEELQEWELQPPKLIRDLDVQKIAEHLFLLVAKMDIEKESKRQKS